MTRLNGVVTNNRPSMTSGVASKPLRFAPPLPSATSPVWNTHATFSRATLARVIWTSGEERAPPASWP